MNEINTKLTTIAENTRSLTGRTDTLSLDDNVFMENLFGKLEYEIVSSEKIDKNTVVVKTKITAVDMKPVLGEFFGKALQYAFANAFSKYLLKVCILTADVLIIFFSRSFW